MLKISAQSEYALILVAYLLKKNDFNKIGDISIETQIKEPILRKIANRLEKWWVIISNKWRNWGIKANVTSISVYDVLNIMWENLGVALCSSKVCDKSWKCEIWSVVANLQRWLESVLKITKL